MNSGTEKRRPCPHCDASVPETWLWCPKCNGSIPLQPRQRHKPGRPVGLWIAALAPWSIAAAIRFSDVQAETQQDPYALDPGVLGTYLIALGQTIGVGAVGAGLVFVAYRFRSVVKEMLGLGFLALWALAILIGLGDMPNGCSADPYWEPTRR
jgi:hypothetical protein